MKTIKNKLNSQSGVSILFAMLLFLVATVVSLVIIVAATSSVKREVSFKESNQKNIELDSLALVLIDNIDKKSYTFISDGKDFVLEDNPTEVFDKALSVISTSIMNNVVTQTYNLVFESELLSNIACTYSFESSGDNKYIVKFELDNGNKLYVYFEVVKDDVTENKLTWYYSYSSNKKV